MSNKPASISVTPKEVEIEVGSEVSTNIDDYATFTGINSANCSLDTSNITDTSVLGNEYTFSVTCGANTYNGTATIVDTTAPSAVPRDVTVQLNGEVSPQDFVSSCTDATDCAYAFSDPEAVNEYLAATGEYSVDIIVTGDIANLYNESLDNYIIGAVWQETEDGYWNQHRKEYLNSSSAHKYFNAGVLLIDCAQWRNNNLFEKLLDIQFEYGEKIKCVDQDLLNKCFDNNYKILPRKYNYLTSNFTYFKNDTDIIIRHMVGRIRPWQINENTKTNLMPNLKEFWHYAKMTPFYEELDAQTHDKQRETDLLRNMQIDLMTWKLYAHHTRVKLEREKSNA